MVAHSRQHGQLTARQKVVSPTGSSFGQGPSHGQERPAMGLLEACIHQKLEKGSKVFNTGELVAAVSQDAIMPAGLAVAGEASSPAAADAVAAADSAGHGCLPPAPHGPRWLNMCRGGRWCQSPSTAL